MRSIKFQRIELIVFTSIYLFFMLLLYRRTSEGDNALFFQSIGAIIFTSVVCFVYYISPRLFGRHKIDWGVGATLLLFIVSWGLLAWSFSNTNRHDGPWTDNLFDSPALPVALVMFLSLFAYEGIKAWISFFQKKEQTLLRKIAKEAFIVVAISVLLTFLSLGLSPKVAYICLAIPYGYCVYALQYYQLLKHLESGKLNTPLYAIISIISAALLFIPFATMIRLASHSWGNEIVVLGICMNAVIIPLTYLLYFNQRKQSLQMVHLRQELGQTSADLKLLQSQINPHFLFNVMNTIYGIALQENAERTAEGVQKLGDMMRFMLHENQQDSILLSREVEYLKEYIDLQSLRTAPVDTVQISYEIPEILEGYHISPMLLIPFVENAFKHGISLNKPSWIRINLSVSDGVLKFSVYNSIHRLQDHDPESAHSGLGLENVKHRLNLMYAKQHHLHIEETVVEFFAFLTLQIRKR